MCAGGCSQTTVYVSCSSLTFSGHMSSRHGSHDPPRRSRPSDCRPSSCRRPVSVAPRAPPPEPPPSMCAGRAAAAALRVPRPRRAGTGGRLPPATKKLSSHAITFSRVRSTVRLVFVLGHLSTFGRYTLFGATLYRSSNIAQSLLPQVEGVTTLRRGRSPRAATADTIKRRAPLCARSSCVPLHIPSITLQIMLATLAAQNFRAWKSLHRVSGAI